MPADVFINSDSSGALDATNGKRSALQRFCRLHWFHWCVLSLSIALTLAAWYLSSTVLAERRVDRFEREAMQVVELVKQRLAHYEDALLAGAALMSSHSGLMTRKQWREYVLNVELTNRYPGINGLGVIREVPIGKIAEFEEAQQRSWPGFDVHPEHEHAIRLPIVYIEPVQANMTAIGLDVAFEDNRRSAALLARDLGSAQISGPISLVQEKSDTPGFLFYVPYYLSDTGFDGLIYAPLVVNSLIAGVLDDRIRHTYFSIEDAGTLIYDEFPAYENVSPDEQYSLITTEYLFGRQWRFSLNSSPAFAEAAQSKLPMFILVTGLIVEALLLALFLMLGRANRMSEALNDRLSKQSIELTQKNSELESYAHIVSHDLKTPLLAIQCLTGFLHEDAEDSEDVAGYEKLIDNHVQRVNEQTGRGLSLIQGVLDFSVIGHETESPEQIDIGELLEAIRLAIGIDDHQMIVDKPMPILNSYPIRLTQVFENLIGNAIKYHPTPENATVHISVEHRPEYYRFLVADDGNGIDEQYHERIFLPFVSLQQDTTTKGTGIGLSIVKKTVEHVGGDIGILPQEKQGTTFYVDWPIVHFNEQE